MTVVIPTFQRAMSVIAQEKELVHEIWSTSWANQHADVELVGREGPAGGAVSFSRAFLSQIRSVLAGGQG